MSISVKSYEGIFYSQNVRTTGLCAMCECIVCQAKVTLCCKGAKITIYTDDLCAHSLLLFSFYLQLYLYILK